MVSELGLLEGSRGCCLGFAEAVVWALLSSWLGLTKPFYAFLCQGLERLIEA